MSQTALDPGIETEAPPRPGGDLRPGLYEVSNDTYHQGENWRDVIGHSGIIRLLRSPLHYKFGLEEDEEIKESFNFGSAYHLKILQPDVFAETVIVSPKFDRRTKQGKIDAEAFEIKAAGKLIITEPEAKHLDRMAEQMSRCHTAAAILKNPGFFERSALWEDPDYGFLGKCRPDFDIPNLGVLVDLKSCRDASLDGFSKAAGNYGYDIEAAWYLDGMTHATGIQYKTFIFIAQEKTPPYAVAVYQSSEEMTSIGKQKVDIARAIYDRCLKTGDWFGYPDRVQKMYIPPWAAKIAGRPLGN